MVNIINRDRLDNEILLLQNKQKIATDQLCEVANSSIESIKPYDIIKNIVMDIGKNAEIKNLTIAFATGYITQVLFVGKSKNVFKKFIGQVLQNMVTIIILENCTLPKNNK